jgi:hypothetical protein
VFQLQRLLFNGSRWDTRWVSGRGKTPTFCVSPVFTAAVMEKCCDACGDGEYYKSGRVIRSQRVPVFQWHRLLFTRSRWDIWWVSGREKTPTFCVFPVFSVAVMEKCCDARGDGDCCIRGRVVWRYRVPVFQWHRISLLW